MLKHITFFVLFGSLLSAQTGNWKKIDSVFSPTGITLNNFTCPFFVDINNDGKQDLLLGNSSGYAQAYIHKGTSPITFRYDTNYLASVYAGGLVGVNYDYPSLTDIMGDSVKELIIGGYNGLVMHENRGTASAPSWIKNDTVFLGVNAVIGSDPKPVFADIDNDGDYDLFVGIGESLLGGPTPGITIAFRNTGNKSLPRFTQDAVLTQSIGDAGLNAYPCFGDLDGDGDLDLVMGRDLQTFIYYRNNGTASAPIWGTGPSLFSGVETRTYWKNPTLTDYDYDGDLDLVYGSDGGKLYAYRNTGNRTTPVFVADNSEFIAIKSDDNGATVSFGDWDRDGDPDFVCGSWLGRFIYFRNDGSLSVPKFSTQTALFSSLDVGSYSHPTFIDFDGDGDLDIVSGELNGKIFCYINNSNSFVQNSTTFAAINVGGFSSPAFVDIDSDGDKDLLVGAESSANTRFFLNAGNNTFIQDDTMFAEVSFPSTASPAFSDVDGDGDSDMLLGSRFGTMYFYRNTGNRFDPIWTSEDTFLQGVVKARQNSSPSVYRETAGVPLSVVVGEYNGNFSFFSNDRGISDISPEHKPVSRQTVIYPNPAEGGKIYVSLSKNLTQVNGIWLYSISGEQISVPDYHFNPESGLVEAKLPKLLSSGIYTVVIFSGTEASVAKLVFRR